MEFPQDLLILIQAALDKTSAEFAKTPAKKHTALLNRIIRRADLVLGVFKDPAHPRGWNCTVIKGEQSVAEILRNKASREFKITAISCRAPEEAAAMKKVFGGLH